MAETRQPDALLDALEREGVVVVDAETDAVSTTEAFEADREVYYDTYVTMPDAEFHQSVAEVFGLDSPDAAAERVDELGVTREEFATFLTLRSNVEGSYSLQELTTMAQMATELGPETPVPEGVEHLDDDSYEAFVDSHRRCVVTVWKLFCDPCEAMKDQLDEVLAAFPEGTPVGGVAGERSPEFCRSVGVNAAPAFVLFDDGEPVEIITGRTDPAALAERVEEVYGS
ncbi:thioredoxin family protein [Haloarcula salina]|uniref:Thioredoxin family protein n=1 Tax=Haloarcula salina TaxID=1429914 RepID=A0AA41FYI8_9EURY|nr:thioredoxin family protein [Haloarcula salina]MBV0900269.1 thioredoxin family protein [Haloarcula salina]